VGREIEPRLRSVPVARPLPPETVDVDAFFRDVPQLTVVHEHRYPEAPVVPWEESSGIAWARLACYLVGLVMLAVVVGLLIAAGVLDVSVPAPPWTR